MPLTLFVCACLAVVGAGAWFFIIQTEIPSHHITSQEPTPATVTQEVAPVKPTTIVQPMENLKSLPSPPPAATPEATVGQLELRYRGERETAARGEIVREIAGVNNADAVLALGRLFQNERNSVTRLAIITALGDVDTDAAPQARMATLTSALHGQPRDVRIAALDGLAQLDDPRALALLRRTGAEDADKQVRETAVALYRALTE